ncbi:MAG: hypothetical protein HFE45_02410 [Oscillospiraceae bacterium]|nr:hypothetical protein [Oscillospiraceae bacterium]
MSQKDKPHAGHRERLKEEYRQKGLEHFPYHKVLELLLFFGIPQRDTNKLAHQLIDDFGSFAQVFRTSIDRLASVSGMTRNAAMLIHMVPEIFNRIIVSELDERGQVMLNGSDQATEYLQLCFAGRTRETVMLFCLDSSCKLLRRDVISEGDIAAAEVNIRALCEIVLYCGSHNILLAHNHPDGYAYPSNQDVRFTENLRKVLKSLDIQLLDHFILGRDGRCASMMQMGYLAVDRVISPE